MTDLIEMSGIGKAFAGVVALRDASLAIRPGEVHAIIGQNGAGKSTLIKILTGVYRRDEGSVQMAGEDLTISTPREAQDAGISTIYQELSLVPLRSVTENVMMGYEPRTRLGLIDWKAAHARTREILARFGVEIDVTRQLGRYSTAIQQLVAIARAVSLDARLVIMDEATSSLDDQEIETLFSVVRELKKSGVAVLYISHFLSELYEICDRVTIMRDGRTVATHEVAQTTRLGLVSEMLGRDASEIAAAGQTALSGERSKPGATLLEVDGLGTRTGLRDVSFEIRKGEIVGLGGLLGSGRTESARAIFGLDKLLRGEVRHHAAPVIDTPARAIALGMGFLTEDRKADGIIPHMSVRENITLALLPRLRRFGAVDRARERELVQGYIDALQIKTSGMEQPIRELSGGNQQKVLLARWLALEPEILILDEPTRGVDVGAKFEIQSIIRNQVAKGLAVLLISSEFEELVEGADRIVVLQDGYSVTELQNPGITESALIGAMVHHHERLAS
ncbi:sugar ABC transporter ATP-binding protein [Primorskyibacter sedentarius]|uniref:Ribose transport system ATP-binding protein n=1 Tax=Primorskyibacter sedentarius TaxID=745311 RepID=A0A4V2UPG1_9RHOB|nr:sugar ABC transporter ATP-binding protein [Primorskyibacter sedentarius]TCS65671.1 ribose transport system ATP-binding protein [Primorskyibacter sedentarius]